MDLIQVGSLVEHKAWGRGKILALRPPNAQAYFPSIGPHAGGAVKLVLSRRPYLNSPARLGPEAIRAAGDTVGNLRMAITPAIREAVLIAKAAADAVKGTSESVRWDMGRYTGMRIAQYRAPQRSRIAPTACCSARRSSSRYKTMSYSGSRHRTVRFSSRSANSTRRFHG
jgi:hypothetical protein